MLTESRKDDTLTALFVAMLVLSNILSVKLISIGPFIVPGGIVCYAISFLISDVINELYGKASGKRAVRIGIIAQLLCTALIALTVALPSAKTDTSTAFNMVLGVNFWFVLASLVSFICASTVDITIFHAVRKRLNGKGKWVWNNLSTITSQIIDTGLYVLIAFGIGQGFLFSADLAPMLWQMIISQIIVKVVLALADTPFFYALMRR